MPTITFTITDKKAMEAMIRSLPAEAQHGFKVQIDYDNPPLRKSANSHKRTIESPGLTEYHEKMLKMFAGRKDVSKRELKDAAIKLGKSPAGVSQLLNTLKKRGHVINESRSHWSFP